MLRYGSKNAVRAAISQRSQKRLTKDKKRLGSLHLAYIISKIYIKSKDFIHPRCGENHNRRCMLAEPMGSPPQVRGKPHFGAKGGTKRRITPAGAGKTIVAQLCELLAQDHPRRCGENNSRSVAYAADKGSPPQVRGKRLPSSQLVTLPRITPAGAGKTLRT